MTERDEELSTREDLHEQLNRQQSVHRQLKDELRKEVEAVDQYLELLIQLQRKGKFYQPRAHLNRRDPRGGEEARVEEENEILRKEIRALSLQLDRVSSDKADLERGGDTAQWKARRSAWVKDVPSSADQTDEEEGSLRRNIAEMDFAVRQARSGNEALTLLVAADRKRAEALNSELVALLSSTEKTCNPDLDQLIRSSVECHARLRNVVEEGKEEKSHVVPAPSSRQKNKALSREEAARALHVLAASPGAKGSEDALRRLCLGVLRAVRHEEENARRIAAHNRHLFRRLGLLQPRVAEADVDEEEGPGPGQAPRRESPRAADAAVAFEQPASGSHDLLLRDMRLSSTSML